MNSPGRLLASLLILVAGALVVAGVMPRPAGAVAASLVQVVNTPSTAIPVNGTVEVSGAVNATIVGSSIPVNGTVQVSSLPSVTLNGSQPVTISNDITHSVYTRDADNAERSAVSLFCNTIIANNNQFGVAECLDSVTVAPYRVPQGMRFVVEYVSGKVELGPNQSLSDIGVLTGIGGGNIEIYLAPTLLSTTNSGPIYAFSTPFRAIGDQGTAIQFQLGRNSQSGVAEGYATIYGHLVDCSTGCSAY